MIYCFEFTTLPLTSPTRERRDAVVVTCVLIYLEANPKKNINNGNSFEQYIVSFLQEEVKDM